MGVFSELNLKPGVIYGDDVLRLFTYAREKGFAIPAVNVVRTVICLSQISSCPSLR